MPKSKGLSPTQRTRAALRDMGLISDTAEKWNIAPNHPAGGFRKDLFGFIDVEFLDPQRGIIGVQACGQGTFSAHKKKIIESECSENAMMWLKCGGKVEIWQWRKIKVKRGGKQMRWMPRIEELTLKDFGGEWLAGASMERTAS